MKNKKIIISVIFALISVSMLSACTYKFKFKTDEIAEIKIDGFDIVPVTAILPEEKWDVLIAGLNELNFTCHSGKVKALSVYTVTITFNNGKNIEINAFRIKQAGKYKHYKCDCEAFDNFVKSLLVL